MSRNKITYGQWTFEDLQIKRANLYLPTSLLSDALEAATFSADVDCADLAIAAFERNAPLIYYHDGMQVGRFYVQDISRIGPVTYTISATSTIGLLIDGEHYGGIYNGETVAEVLPGICGPVPYEIKTSLRNIALYGWLPVASRRDNLSQVLFAIGASVKTDLDGILRIEGLWNGASGSIGEDNLYQGQGVEYAAKVTRVVVTEHQYTPGTEEIEVFSGTAKDGDIITFSEPLHTLMATGFTIVESGANYAVLSAGTGTLTGRAYIHNTRQVSRSVAQADVENVVSVTDATLVSLVNSVSVTERLANYYACREVITGDVALGRQSPGDVVYAYHPYEKELVQTCIESLDINVSGVLKATARQLVGFKPLQAADTYDYREVIVADMEWEVPEGVFEITAVLISGGRGGYSGFRGKEIEYPAEYNSTESGYYGYDPGPGADGGEGGDVGEGGNIFQVSVSVVPGQKFQAHIGPGGIGGLHADTGSAQGSPGGATTFGPFSSDSGVPSPDGYTDILTGEVYAKPGDRAGIPGGKGSGYIGDGQYEQGPAVEDYDGNTWQAGPATNPSENLQKDYGPYHAESGKGCGGGAAVGANGSPGGYGKIETARDDWDYEIYPYTGPTGHGGDAVKPAKQTKRGYGGNGGHGGGGEGGMGLALYNGNPVDRWARISEERGYPGDGSDGSDGGDGILLLYYKRPVTTFSGAVIGADHKIFLDKAGRLVVV